MKAKIVLDQEGRFYGISYRCPGCAAAQGDTDSGLTNTILPVRWLPPGLAESPYVNGSDHWDFNGDMENPVFGPSVLSTWPGYQGEDLPPKEHRCHAWIGINGAPPGHIIFLADSTHALAGQVLPLPELED